MRTAWILAAVICCVGCKVEDRPGPDPGPGDHAALAERAVRDYAAGLAKLSRDTAARIESGELQTDRDVHEAFSSGSLEVRQQAFRKLDEAWQAKLGDGRWDAHAAARLLREEAKGYDRAD